VVPVLLAEGNKACAVNFEYSARRFIRKVASMTRIRVAASGKKAAAGVGV
jgi:hypothetical protein